MEPITLVELAGATGGRLAGADAPAGALVGPDVVIDSRQASRGALFVALPGERVDGHDFLAGAAEAGAAAALVTREVDVPLPQVLVAGGVRALADLATHVVARGKARGLVVVGVTGSSGKTSTKDLIASVLESGGPTVAPPGSFNNEIGAPLTACRVDAATRYLVTEMGARGLGHVAALCRVTPPTIGAVLNVGHAHLGEFGSVEQIAVAKGELVEALDANGWAVLNADDPRVIAMALRTQARVAAWSSRQDPVETGAALRVWAADIDADELQRHRFTLHVAGDDRPPARADVTLRVLGEHQVANALAAATVALAAGLEPDAVAAALSAAQPRSRWRMELVERTDGLAILNDSYNANPDSMSAALVALSRLRRPGGRLVAALGDMLELGDGAASAHRGIGELAAELGIDELVATGAFGHDLIAGFGDAGSSRYVEDVPALTRHLDGSLGPADVLLVKASRGLALDRVADALVADGGARP